MSTNFFHKYHWRDWAGLITSAAVGAFLFLSYSEGDSRRWWALGIFVIFIALETWRPQNASASLKHIHLAGLSALVVMLYFVGADPTSLIILLFILSAFALASLGAPFGYLWIGFYGLITILGLSTVYHTFLPALLTGLGALGGYFFIGSAADAQMQAERAKNESQRLLDELQRAHRELQANAEQAEELAIAEERNCLAREVHDTVGHRLTVSAVQLEGAKKLIDRDPDKAKEMIGTVHSQVVEGLEELRRTIASLRNPAHAEVSLNQSITALARNFEEATGIEVALNLPFTPLQMPASHRQTIFRTTQEALTNIQKHAQASKASVKLAAASGLIELTIEDNGTGLNGAGEGGYGLRGMAERASALAGDCSLQASESLGGLAVTLSLPL